MKTCLGIIKSGNFLLFIKKMRGLGEGLITFPGGKAKENESAEECIKREVKEELGIDINNPRLVAKINFYLDMKFAETMYVFLINEFQGIPSETEEAVPMWLNYIPYENMWADDKVWLPLILKGERVCCDFYFSDNWKKYDGGKCNSCELT